MIVLGLRSDLSLELLILNHLICSLNLIMLLRVLADNFSCVIKILGVFGLACALVGGSFGRNDVLGERACHVHLGLYTFWVLLHGKLFV